MECHQYPLFHHLWPQIEVDVLQFATIAAIERDILHLAHVVWAQDDTRSHCSELATATSSFDLI